MVISINHDAEEALKRSEPDVPGFRGYVRLRGVGGGPADLETLGHALDAALRLIEAIGAPRRRWRDIRRIHFFIAGPAGFAVLVGPAPQWTRASPNLRARPDRRRGSILSGRVTPPWRLIRRRARDRGGRDVRASIPGGAARP